MEGSGRGVRHASHLHRLHCGQMMESRPEEALDPATVEQAPPEGATRATSSLGCLLASLVNVVGCLVMGSDRRAECVRFSDGDVGVADSDLDDDDLCDTWWPPRGLTRAKWSCGEPLMWMCGCVSACSGVEPPSKDPAERWR